MNRIVFSSWIPQPRLSISTQPRLALLEPALYLHVEPRAEKSTTSEKNDDYPFYKVLRGENISYTEGRMYRIGLILGPVVFLGAVLEWILRLTHYVDLVEKTLPWTKCMTTPEGIWITVVVGILIFVAAWAERKKEKGEEIKHREGKPEGGAPHTPIASVGIANPIQTANPVIDASQKVEIHNHPASLPPIPAHPSPRSPGALPPHNVQFKGVKQIRTDIAREVFDSNEGFVGLKACFSNKIIPGTKTRDFDYVKARIVLRDASGAEVAEITRPIWLDHEPGDAIHIEVNQTQCILLAIFGGDDEWAAPFISTNSSNYWDDGTRRLIVDGCSLRAGELSAEITLVGEDNVGLEPVAAYFSLGPVGDVEIRLK
jgi:hypothetical protein